MPRSYIQQILFFPSCDPRIEQILRSGIISTVKDVPHLACSIITREAPRGSIELSEPNHSLHELFSCRDLSMTVDYTELKSKHFTPLTFSGLDILPNGLNERPSPAFRAVLSRVLHGFLLCVCVHHSTTDITGLGSLLKIWASHCKTGSSEATGFGDDWLYPGDMVGNPALVLGPLPKLLHIENDSTSATKDPEMCGLETTIFIFEKDFLHHLKCEVNKVCVTAGLSWVSTGDILSALLWSAVVFSENSLDPSIYAGSDYQEGQVCHMRFPVNFRSRCKPPLPENYLGGAFAVNLAVAEGIDLYQVASGDDCPALISALTKVATAIRRAIISVDRANVKDMISYLAAQQDITKVRLGPKHTGLSIVSWAAQNIYQLDWGEALGCCEAMRPFSFRGKRYPIVLPRLPNGNFEVVTCLEKSTMNRLKEVWFMKQQ